MLKVAKFARMAPKNITNSHNFRISGPQRPRRPCRGVQVVLFIDYIKSTILKNILVIPPALWGAWEARKPPKIQQISTIAGFRAPAPPQTTPGGSSCIICRVYHFYYFLKYFW